MGMREALTREGFLNAAENYAYEYYCAGDSPSKTATNRERLALNKLLRSAGHKAIKPSEPVPTRCR